MAEVGNSRSKVKYASWSSAEARVREKSAIPNKAMIGRK